jgi:N-acetylneuraminate synthase
MIIAEAGVNHNGSIDRALQLVDAAADAGADVVKFQSFKAVNLATKRAAKADYQVANTGQSDSQLAMLQSLELGADDHRKLAEHCRTRNIAFMSTAFDAESLALLSAFDMPAIKIPSGDITCADLLLRAARLRRRLIVSTGMATLGEIEQALGVIAFGLTSEREPAGSADFEAAYLSDAGKAALQEHVTLLHCVTEYPAPAQTVNLRAMDTMAAAFRLPVGYSDHTLGIAVSLAAVARGATLIEKHFTLDSSLPGPDHRASLEPDQLRALVSGVREIEYALGSPCKGPAPVELRNRTVARRSLVAARRISKGERFTPDMIAAKRPGDGMSPMQAFDLVGRTASRDFDVDEQLEP